MIEVKAELVGNVWKIVSKPGDVVAEDQTLLILESMKMEHVVRAPAAGVIHAVEVDVGALVAVGDPLAVVEASGLLVAANLVTPAVARPFDGIVPLLAAEFIVWLGFRIVRESRR